MRIKSLLLPFPPVRATWHPLVDVVVAGRYPDPAFPGTLPGELRTVDFFDPDTGDVMHQLSEPNINKIMSLNRYWHGLCSFVSLFLLCKQSLFLSV